jgi:hypothetical protein
MHEAPVRHALMEMRQRPMPPTVTREPRITQRNLEATDARYNPVELIQELRHEGLTLRDIFEREPRDPQFAPVLERRVNIMLKQALQELQLEGLVHGVKAECKTLSCYTFISVDSTDAERVYEAINGVLLGDSQAPSVVTSSKDRPAGVTIYNLYRPDARTEAGHARFLEEGMRPGLEMAKQRTLGASDAARP